jgi:hypothetical protein
VEPKRNKSIFLLRRIIVIIYANPDSITVKRRTVMYKYEMIGKASDYSDKNNWHMIPEKDAMGHDVDVIYFMGTLSANEDGCDICEIDEPTLRAPGAADFDRVTDIFSPFCNVFFPWWRQVDTSAVYRLGEEEVDKLQYHEPRTDVYAIMDYYFENYNNGKPFFLVGHSQGARMISIILEDYMVEHPECYEKMIAAYRVGDGLTRDYLKANPHVKPAQCADDLNVCISWCTEGKGNESFYGLIAKPDCVCINPLNWKTDDTYASADQNLGCKIPDPESGTTVRTEGFADAQINTERGSVVATTEKCKEFMDWKLWGEEAKMAFGPESYHTFDFSFYYYNIRENAKLRVKKWFETNA